METKVNINIAGRALEIDLETLGWDRIKAIAVDFIAYPVLTYEHENKVVVDRNQTVGQYFNGNESQRKQTIWSRFEPSPLCKAFYNHILSGLASLLEDNVHHYRPDFFQVDDNLTNYEFYRQLEPLAKDIYNHFLQKSLQEILVPTLFTNLSTYKDVPVQGALAFQDNIVSLLASNVSNLEIRYETGYYRGKDYIDIFSGPNKVGFLWVDSYPLIALLTHKNLSFMGSNIRINNHQNEGEIYTITMDIVPDANSKDLLNTLSVRDCFLHDKDDFVWEMHGGD